MDSGGRIACSIVVPSHNRGRLLRNTLVSLAHQSCRRGSFEVIVVDDGSEDGTHQVVKDLNPPYAFQYIAKPYSNSRAQARNWGIRAARGDVLIFLDAEMLCPPGFVSAHLDLHARYGPCMVCGWDRRLAEVPPTPLPEDWEAWARDHLCERQWTPGQGQVGAIPFVTCNASCRRLDAIEVGLFDEAFTGYGHEDLDLGHRLYLLGRRTISSPSTVAYHQPHPRPGWLYVEKDRNSAYFRRKHHEPRRIIHFMDGFWCGGAERSIVSLARHLHGPQHELTLALAEPPVHFGPELAEIGVTVAVADYESAGLLLASRGADAAHVHYAPSGWLDPLRALGDRVPVVASVHLYLTLPAQPGLRRVVYPLYCLAARHPGPREEREVIWLGTDPCAFAPSPCGRLVRRALGLPDDALVFGTGSRLDDVKLTPPMFDVYVELVRRHPKAYVLLCGGGDSLEEYRDRVTSLQLGDRIIMPGTVDDMAAHLGAMDVCLHVVEVETFGCVLLEAMAVGLPVIAPAMDGLAETVRHGTTGFLCSGPDEMLVRALEFANGVHDPKVMGRRARERARTFDDRRTALKFKLLYDEVICGARYSWPWPAALSRSARASASR